MEEDTYTYFIYPQCATAGCDFKCVIKSEAQIIEMIYLCPKCKNVIRHKDLVIDWGDKHGKE